MSYDEIDASRDEMYDVISQELYPGHKQQAIEEFSSDRLRSYYMKNPGVMMPAIEAAHEAKALIADGRYSPALVFSASATELLLKATLLRPVVYIRRLRFATHRIKSYSLTLTYPIIEGEINEISEQLDVDQHHIGFFQL